MTNPVSSPARLTDIERIELFKRIFIYHGAIPGETVTDFFSEADRIRIVPLIFGLMPSRAVHRLSRDTLVKPLIVEHLRELGIKSDDHLLVTVLKEIADQLYFTSGQRPVRRKMGIADLRMTRMSMYKALRQRQAERCSLCGVPLKDAEEHLDHRIPFRLLGDIAKGTNWQLLCNDCNVGKSSWLSALQPSVAQNWLYGDLDMEDLNHFDNENSYLGLTARYCVLAQRKSCTYPGCGNGVKDSQLRLKLRLPSALPVVDHFEVRCQEHFYATASSV
ncbi:HNH endonuclease signature motif containing protein [Variovorax humicola]|uniref:HNH endonuclease signature motif containing protein n=1 Tax=Variovorax humicola TaxID=1769758 RepID=A0ABU8W8B5_9BURK